MLEGLILGTIQGIAEWLPISSEGLVVLASARWFSDDGIATLVQLALFLHLGTFSAALVYLRRDIWRLLRTFLRFKSADDPEKKVLVFLIVATFATGVVGGAFFAMLKKWGTLLVESGATLSFFIGMLLVVTALLQFRGRGGEKQSADLSLTDALIIGGVQGLAILPGLSRSGSTVATFLLRGFDDTAALRLSFLLSLPAVAGGNILVNANMFTAGFTLTHVFGFFAAFLFGLLTIHFLLRVARRVQFGYFALGFGALLIVAAFL